MCVLQGEVIGSQTAICAKPLVSCRVPFEIGMLHRTPIVNLACPLPPRANFLPKTVESVQSILDGLVLFRRPAVVHVELVQSYLDPILRYLDFLLYFRPVGFEQCGRVEFLPFVLHMDIHVLPHPQRSYYKRQMRGQLKTDARVRTVS